MTRPYLLAMACGMLAATAIVAALCWVIDPLGIYESLRIDGFDALKPALKTRSRVFKTVKVANGDWEAIIVGTSRAETAFDPHHPFFEGKRCFNAALGGQNYDESLALVRAAVRSGKLRSVVAVLDFEVANAHYEGAPDFVPDNYRPWRKASLAMSLDVLGQALRTPLRQDREELLRDQTLWLPDGRVVFPSPVGGHRALALVNESEYLGVNYFRGPALQFALATPSSQPMERVRALFALAHAHNIGLTLVIAPSHARQLETIAAAGLWNDFEAWKRMLVVIDAEEARKAGRSAFAIWDFSGYSEVTTEPSRHWTTAGPCAGTTTPHTPRQPRAIACSTAFPATRTRPSASCSPRGTSSRISRESVPPVRVGARAIHSIRPKSSSLRATPPHSAGVANSNAERRA
jgi:hypothetical protein